MSRAADDDTPPNSDTVQALHARAAALEAQLERVATEQEAMLAVLGHELRNPLSAIRTAVTLQRRMDAADPRFARCQTIIESQSVAIIELVDVLRDVSRLARDKLALETAPCDLRALLADALDARRPLLEERGITLEVAPGEDACLLELDATRMREVILALIDRAIDAIARESHDVAHLEVALECGDADGSVRVRVRDDGVTPSPEALATMFAPFERADRLDQRLALELARAHGVVELHGGHLEAVPGTGRGTLVTLQLTRR